MDLCVLKTSWGIPGGTPLSGSAEVAAGQSVRRPQVRRAGVLRKNGSKRIVYSKNSLVKYSRGRGAGAENQYTRSPRGVPEMVLSPRREHHFRRGGCAGRPRVREGGSGGLPELMLGSPKVILELPGAHFGFSEGHF